MHFFSNSACSLYDNDNDFSGSFDILCLNCMQLLLPVLFVILSSLKNRKFLWHGNSSFILIIVAPLCLLNFFKRWELNASPRTCIKFIVKNKYSLYTEKMKRANALFSEIGSLSYHTWIAWASNFRHVSPGRDRGQAIHEAARCFSRIVELWSLKLKQRLFDIYRIRISITAADHFFALSVLCPKVALTSLQRVKNSAKPREWSDRDSRPGETWWKVEARAIHLWYDSEPISKPNFLIHASFTREKQRVRSLHFLRVDKLSPP